MKVNFSHVVLFVSSICLFNIQGEAAIPDNNGARIMFDAKQTDPEEPREPDPDPDPPPPDVKITWTITGINPNKCEDCKDPPPPPYQ